MPVNPYFQYSSNDQKLLDELTVETIKVTGREMYYIPREYFKIDRILGEDIRSKFKSSYAIECYLVSVYKFDGQMDLITKYGIMNTDRATIQIAKTRFQQIITSKNPNIVRPREGDIIFFPESDSIFEINKMEDETPFYQLGKLTTFTMSLELFTYSQEEFDTGIDKLDEATSGRRDFVRLLLLKGIGGGDYVVGETITHSGYTASVHDFIKGITNSTLYVMDEKGTLNYGVTLTGEFSNAGYTAYFASYTNTIIPTDPVRDESDGDNLDFERERARKDIFNLNEKDPFSKGEY